jgi:Baseplate J-like protein
MTAPTEREFLVYQRGEVREIILANFREGLRVSIDPDTGAVCTEDTIRRVTQPGSRFYVEADAIDLCLLGQAKRAEFLAQQISHDRAGSAFLRTRHAPLWGEEFLPGFSSTGTVLATGTTGTTWVGSTDIPDQLASFCTDPAGNRYQVFISGVADANGEAELTLASIDTGDAVNIEAGTVLTWGNPPAGSTPTCTVTADFTGGSPAETDADFAARLGSRIAHKPAAGNAAQFRAWAREASVSVEDAFIYPTAFNAGSVLVVPTQKRGDSLTSTARIPNAGVLTAVTERMVPPASPVVPPHVRVMVVAPVAHETDLVVLLSLLKGSSVGWFDAEPFPESRGALEAVMVTTVTTQTNFRVTAGSAGQLPGGVSGPLADVNLMIWDEPTGNFIELDVSTVEDLGAGVYRVILTTPPSGHTIALNDYVSPLTERSDAIAAGAQTYFDGLGPGEVVDLPTDPRGVSAFRQPPPNEEFPMRAGQSIITAISEALGSAVADATLDNITDTEPVVPSDPGDGPELMVLGKLAVYPLD